MAGYPRYDLTKPSVDPKGMTDAELQKVIADLEADLADARRMAYQLTEDVKKRRGLKVVYRAFWRAREGGRLPVKYRPQKHTMVLYQKNAPFLSVGIHSLGPLGTLKVLPDPPRSYMERFWDDVWEWVITPGPYRRPHY